MLKVMGLMMIVKRYRSIDVCAAAAVACVARTPLDPDDTITMKVCDATLPLAVYRPTASLTRA